MPPGYIQLDYDPTNMVELCNKSSSLGGLFVDNISACADCVSNKGGLNSFFDQSDAQDALDIVNLCQSNFPTNHDEMVSAMSVISERAGLVGSIATAPISSTSTTAPATGVPATTTEAVPSASETTTDESTHSENKGWIAGAVIGPIAGVALVIMVFILLRRRKRRQSTELPADSKDGVGHLYEKAELPAEGNEQHELSAQTAIETKAKTAPQELASNAVSELPANESVDGRSIPDHATQKSV